MTPFLSTYRRTPAQRAMDRKLLQAAAEEAVVPIYVARNLFRLPDLVTPPCPACGYDRASAGKCAGCGEKR